MKYGETLRQRSIPAWSAYNIDYDDIKHFIKERTTPGQGKAVAVPGRGVDDKAREFENDLFLVLEEQHHRIDLFVKSKAREIQHRLDDAKKRLRHLAARNSAADQRVPVTRLERYGRLENDVLKAGEEIKSLSRFTSTQKTAFRKLLKKYKKWTGDTKLEERFRSAVLDDEKSFTRHDLRPLLDEYSETLNSIRTLYEIKLQVSQRQDSKADSGKSVTGRLHASLASGSKIDFDTAMGTVPLSETGTFASYFVHPDNVVELQVLLLQHARYYLSRSRTSSTATPTSSSPRSDSPLGAQRPQSNFHVLAADDPDRFIREQSAVTVDEREHTAGSTAQRTKACARWNAGDDEACLTARSKASDLTTTSLKQKYLASFFGTDRPFLPRRGSIQGEQKTLDALRSTLEKEKIRPLYQMSTSRSRLVGLHNTSDSVLLATLDSDISFFQANSSGGISIESGIHDFPFALLQIRYDCSEDSALIRVLDKSHLAERVRGFSMEYHAIWTTCKQDTAAPFWIPTLSRDIRKLPPPVAKRTISTSASPSATPGSGSNGGSATAVDSPRRESSLTFESPTLQAPPLRAFRKKRRRSYARQRVQEQPRYWSEYDHPEEGSEGGDAYLIYIDPNEKSVFETFFEKLSTLFSRPKPRDGLESSLPSPSEADDETSDDDDELDPLLSARSKPRQKSAYGALPLPVSHPQKRPAQPFLPLLSSTCLIASVLFLIVGYLLAATGKRKLVKEVDAGVVLTVISSLFFAIVGFGNLFRLETVRWLAWLLVGAVMVVDAVGNAWLVAWMLG